MYLLKKLLLCKLLLGFVWSSCFIILVLKCCFDETTEILGLALATPIKHTLYLTKTMLAIDSNRLNNRLKKNSRFKSFLRPYKISMKVILIFMLKKKYYAQITKIDFDFSGQKSNKHYKFNDNLKTILLLQYFYYDCLYTVFLNLYTITKSKFKYFLWAVKEASANDLPINPWKNLLFSAIIEDYVLVDLCSKRVINVEMPGQRQLLAKRAYLNSSSHTKYSANLIFILFSGLKSCTN
ncbi:hypothetical protein BpHYR1_043821 [Brachionus plicatilis]|uniref:Uncharacterized protein n=1 Tax=Brachionus plicatilis TaxID=10195 RepID=A0A3M7RWZ3_BRAPC|nr:hypothetical protein BpHYR1_043821 [Brachionus plicatilis]